MKQIEVFMDYACPFCSKGWRMLLPLLPDYPNAEIVWRLCEASPRPEDGSPDESHGKHSDLCIQAAFYAADQGVDMIGFHDKMYYRYHKEKLDVEDIETLVGALTDLVDPDGLRDALVSGKYRQALKDANDYAYNRAGVYIIPAFRMGGHKLDSAAMIGVTQEQIKDFLNLTR
ncbi:MAG: DsbA family protein [Oscillospiraceae bacterium]|nr:DsbA family protein [Oscillospiraceae bacterium]